MDEGGAFPGCSSGDSRDRPGFIGVAEASLTSATKAIEKARAILAAIEPLLPDDAVGNA